MRNSISIAENEVVLTSAGRPSPRPRWVDKLVIVFTATAALDELEGQVQIRGIRLVLISAEVILLVEIYDTVAYRYG